MRDTLLGFLWYCARKVLCLVSVRMLICNNNFKLHILLVPVCIHDFSVCLILVECHLFCSKMFELKQLWIGFYLSITVSLFS